MISRAVRRTAGASGRLIEARPKPPAGAPVARLALVVLLAGAVRFPGAPGHGRLAGESAAAPRDGVRVMDVAPGSALARAGLARGDLVLRWARPAGARSGPPAAGKISSVFDWLWLETEQAPRGEVALGIERRGRQLWVRPPGGAWNARVQPWLPEAMAAAARRCDEVVGRASVAPAAACEALARGAYAARSPGARCWLLLEAGRAWTAAGRPERARAAAVAALRLAGGPRTAVAIWRELAEAALARRDWRQAAAPAGEALRVAAAAWGDSLELAQAELDLGAVAMGQGQPGQAEEQWRRSLALRERLAPASVEVAVVLGRLAGPAMSRGDADAAEQLAGRALDLLHRLAAPGLEAEPLMVLGSAARERGDPERALRCLRSALALHPESAPDLTTADILNRLGLVARRRGDLEEAQRLYERALVIWDRFAPDDLGRTNVVMNLAWVASDQGDLATARRWMSAAVAARERLQPGSLPLANVLDQLGSVVEDQGDLDLAESLFLRALAILEQTAPGAMRTALVLGDLGELALRRNQPDRAADLCQRALAIQERLAPTSAMLAGNLETLAEAELARHRLDAAWAAARRSLAQASASGQGDGSRLQASVRAVLGEVARQRGRRGLAASLFRQALAIQESKGYGGYEVADTLHALAALVRDRQPDAAARYLDRALALLEAQVHRLGGSHDLQAAYRARHQTFYRDAIGLAVERGLPQQALGLLERSRGQGLLAQLAERELSFAGDIPPPVRQQERRIAADIDQTELRLLQFERPAESPDLRLLRDRLAELHRRHDEIVSRIRLACPRFAALKYPQPLDLAGVRRALDPGTVMLSYSLGERRSYLFVVSADGPLAVRRLPVGEAVLRRRVTELRELIGGARGTSVLAAGRRRRLEQVARDLYAMLLRPAAAQIAAGRRLLVVPDGVLQLLPWGALIGDAPGPRGKSWKYLAEWKPIHVAVSATVYDDLRRRRGEDRGQESPKALAAFAPGGGARPGWAGPAGTIALTRGPAPGPSPPPACSLVAFGDPRMPGWLSAAPAVRVADVGLRSALARGCTFEPLPYSRLEVESIAGLFAGGARTYLGAAATEERAKAVGRGVRYLHFATHTTLDEQSPLNSAVVLAIPERFARGGENGLLQAWEVFDAVRIDADLVVLSGCESALGKEVDGEGLQGLTRAFQYAGAQAVVASLWKVSDRMTAPLMLSFYRALRAGMPKDEALRHAQLELLHGAAVSLGPRDRDGAAAAAAADDDADLAPFYWAGFELFGDWR